MPRKCQITGKIPVRGNSYAIRGIAKKKKGVGLKVTGIKRRRFNPNLFKKRMWDPDKKQFVLLNVSAHGLRVIQRLGMPAALRQMRKRGEKV